jgi:hypothetical protein
MHLSTLFKIQKCCPAVSDGNIKYSVAKYLGQFVNAGLKLIYTEELMRYADGQVEGLSPEDVRDRRVVSKIELEYLQRLKDFCKNSNRATSGSNADSASSQMEAFSQG